jgi:nucleoid-associated protein YgaU
MARGFGFDFSKVRVHTDDRAHLAADGLQAHAFTVGSHVVFGSGEYAPHTRHGRALLAHELAHVVQTNRPGPGDAGEASIESDADRAAEAVLAGRAARPALSASPGPHCKLRQTGRVPDGQYTIDMGEDPGTVGRRADVRIEFMPDKSGPVTDRITFLQIAQPRTDGKALPWKDLHQGEEIVDRIRTREADGTHVTKPGDTLATVSAVRYGVPDHAARLYEANRGLGISPDPAAALPVGRVLTVPGAVQGDFNLDISPADVKRRGPGDPNVSGDYPHLEHRTQTTQTTMPGGLTFSSVTPGRAIGRNPKDGAPESAVMVDKPGGGPLRSTFRFETTAHAEEIGHSYGAVQWGFDYQPLDTSISKKPYISNEFARITPHVSDTVRAAVVAFNKDVGNRHVVQEGETLRALSLRYYKTSGRAYAMFMVNPGILPRFDPDAPLPPGKQLELPTPWDVARYGSGGVRPDPAEQDTVWDRIRRGKG